MGSISTCLKPCLLLRYAGIDLHPIAATNQFFWVWFLVVLHFHFSLGFVRILLILSVGECLLTYEDIYIIIVWNPVPISNCYGGVQSEECSSFVC